ncbi:MAG: hypothetical protein GX442_26075 [Candidatus Riflebacteria bacterium]|nr:hypothetical protein [Candidatus Riflebacteria bacterium]
MHMRAVTLSLLVFLVLTGLPAAFGQDAYESAGFSLPPAPPPTDVAPPDKPLANLVKALEEFRTTVDELVFRYQTWVKNNQFYSLPETTKGHPRPALGNYPWMKHLQETREAVMRVTEAYDRAVKAGWEAGDPNITDAARQIEEGKRRLGVTGLWFARRVDQPAIAEDATLERLVDEACLGLMGARSKIFRGYVEDRWAQIDQINKQLVEKNRQNTEVLYNLSQHAHYRNAVKVLEQIRQQTIPLLKDLPASPPVHVHGPNCGHAHQPPPPAAALEEDPSPRRGITPGPPAGQGEPAGY